MPDPTPAPAPGLGCVAVALAFWFGPLLWFSATQFPIPLSVILTGVFAVGYAACTVVVWRAGR